MMPSIPRYARIEFLSSMYKGKTLVSRIHKCFGTISAFLPRSSP